MRWVRSSVTTDVLRCKLPNSKIPVVCLNCFFLDQTAAVDKLYGKVKNPNDADVSASQETSKCISECLLSVHTERIAAFDLPRRWTADTSTSCHSCWITAGSSTAVLCVRKLLMDAWTQMSHIPAICQQCHRNSHHFTEQTHSNNTYQLPDRSAKNHCQQISLPLSCWLSNYSESNRLHARCYKSTIFTWRSIY